MRTRPLPALLLALSLFTGCDRSAAAAPDDETLGRWSAQLAVPEERDEAFRRLEQVGPPAAEHLRRRMEEWEALIVELEDGLQRGAMLLGAGSPELDEWRDNVSELRVAKGMASRLLKSGG